MVKKQKDHRCVVFRIITSSHNLPLPELIMSYPLLGFEKQRLTAVKVVKLSSFKCPHAMER